jgi:hypothetical protein
MKREQKKTRNEEEASPLVDVGQFLTGFELICGRSNVSRFENFLNEDVKMCSHWPTNNFV